MSNTNKKNYNKFIKNILNNKEASLGVEFFNDIFFFERFTRKIKSTKNGNSVYVGRFLEEKDVKNDIYTLFCLVERSYRNTLSKKFSLDDPKYHRFYEVYYDNRLTDVKKMFEST